MARSVPLLIGLDLNGLTRGTSSEQISAARTSVTRGWRGGFGADGILRRTRGRNDPDCGFGKWR